MHCTENNFFLFALSNHILHSVIAMDILRHSYHSTVFVWAILIAVLHSWTMNKNKEAAYIAEYKKDIVTTYSSPLFTLTCLQHNICDWMVWDG